MLCPRGATAAAPLSPAARQPRGKRPRALVHRWPSRPTRAASWRQRAGDGLGAQQLRVEAAGVLVQLCLAGPRSGRRGSRSRAVATLQALAQRGLTYSMPVPSGPHSHFCPAPAYASQPSACTSTGTAPTPWAPSSSTGTSTSAELRGREAAAHPADVRAGDEARARADCVGDLRERHRADRDAAAARAPPTSAPSSPGCSSSLVTISSPRPSSQAADHLGDAPRSCEVVSARSAASRSRAPRRRAARSSALSSERRSKCAVARPCSASRSSSARGRLHRARGQRPVGAGVQIRQPLEGRETRHVTREVHKPREYPACPAPLRRSRCGNRPPRIASAPR